jgi:tetratricopeptide (TPR) repeat protein
LESIKRNKHLPLPLLITASEQALNEERISFHFDDIHKQTSKFTGTEEDAIHYFARGIDFYLVQDLAAAIHDFTQAIVADGSLWLSYYSRAVARYKQMEMAHADAASSGQVKRADAPTDFMADSRINDYQLILGDLDKAIDLAPDFAYTYYNRGNVLSNLKDYRAAIVSYNDAIALEPNLAEAYYNRGLTYIFLGENARGISDLSKAGELGLFSAYNLIKRFAE